MLNCNHLDNFRKIKATTYVIQNMYRLEALRSLGRFFTCVIIRVSEVSITPFSVFSLVLFSVRFELINHRDSSSV